ncbi:MAG: hypothetical protein AB1744_03860 [Candidatus Zixiibacteriota bacterium]
MIVPAVFCTAVSAAADDIPVDSTDMGVADSARAPDTLSQVPTLDDSLRIDDTTAISFQERYEQFLKKRERLPRLSYFDSVATYFLPERLNRRRFVEQSFHHDAGDYFRSDPSYFILEHQVTPMRNTVQPFGLSGDRLAILAEGNQLRPFEHVPEPDGRVDLNDVPTALDHDVYLLPGPLGWYLSAEHSVATLLTRPKSVSSYSPEALLLADKGAFGYSFVRGTYSKKFVNGRYYDLSIGYRDADGPAYLRDDDAYHYYGDLYFPVGSRAGLTVWGRLYNRDGRLVVRPDVGGATMWRERTDRSYRVSFDVHNNEHTTRWEIGYGRSLNETGYRGVYHLGLDLMTHEGFIAREWLAGNAVVQVKVHSAYTKIEFGAPTRERADAGATIRIARLSESVRWAVAGGTRYVEDFDVLPWAAGMAMYESSHLLAIMVAGYSERPPSLLEMHLPFQRVALYGLGSSQYVEQGDDKLDRERQLIGSMLVQVGTPSANVELAVTGGRILDGIDWYHDDVTDSTGTYAHFTPQNGDIDFLDLRLQPQIELFHLFSLTLGAAYHYLNYAAIDNKPYSPEYQFFAGGELHVYWPQRLLHLYAYGEIVYAGPYDGYSRKGLGEDPIANAKLSLGLRGFRFNLVFQNVFGRVYRSRELNTFPGRYFYYGIEWHFID